MRMNCTFWSFSFWKSVSHDKTQHSNSWSVICPKCTLKVIGFRHITSRKKLTDKAKIFRNSTVCNFKI